MNVASQSITPISKKLRWCITIAVMLAAMIEVLDMTIVNVSLPHMMGALGANTQQITWVLTSYIVASAILMPLTGFLTDRFGRKRLLLICIAGFLITSVFSGMSTSLTEIIIFRSLQGAFGAALVPISQQVLQITFPKEEQAKAMAIWGIGIMVAPIMGPTIGGYITEALSWRWVFYINVPICILAFFMTLRFIQDTPRQKRFVDWLGLALMTIGIGALQIFLDQGNDYNWFQSNFIVFLAIIAIVTITVFIIRGIHKSNNIINLNLFRDRNFVTSTTILACFSAAMFGLLTIVPMMLEQLMNYPTSTTGMVLAPQGVASAIAMGISVRLIKNEIDPRKLMICGLLAAASGSWIMAQFGLVIGMKNIMLAAALSGFGMGLFFVPVTMLAYNTLAKKDIPEGSGLFSFGRSLGSSIGISILSTILTREMQINWNRLGGYIRPDNANLQLWLQAHHLTLNNPLTMQLLGRTLEQQASMIAMLDCYKFSTLCYLILLPFVFLIQKPDPGAELAATH